MESDNQIQLQISAEDEGKRLDVFLAERVATASRSQLRKLIDQGRVTVSGAQVKSGFRLEADQIVVVDMPPPVDTQMQPVEMSLHILFEDSDLIVVNKPAGLMMHPGAGADQATLVHGLLAHCGKNLSFLGEHTRPGIVHRLDKDTSGVVVCAKTNQAHAHLAAQFEQKTNYRQYNALLDGRMPSDRMSRTSFLARDPSHRTKIKSWPDAEDAPAKARRAVSHFQKKATYLQRLTEVSVQLETGRTHQIRVHAADLRMPVVGDQLYHRPVQLPDTFPYAVRTALAEVSRQLLHARYLGFEHPSTGVKLAFEAPLPEDFERILAVLTPLKD